jgi:FlaA1/EpsC-like NDP-sugar epimerase
MGEQIKVLDMARNLIRLAGLTPDKDIPIVFVGLRPGEKLSEALVDVDETGLPSGVEDIVCVQPRVLPEAAWLTQQVAALERAALQGNTAATRRMLRTVVPTFQPSSMCPEKVPVELGQKVL